MGSRVLLICSGGGGRAASYEKHREMIEEKRHFKKYVGDTLKESTEETGKGVCLVLSGLRSFMALASDKDCTK